MLYDAARYQDKGETYLVDAMVKWMLELLRQICVELGWLGPVLFSFH